MPKHRSRERWEHPNYKYAYVINRNGICYTIIDGQEKKAIKHLFFTDKNKKEALRILNERLIEKLKSIEKQKTKFLYETIEEFKLLYFDKLSKHTIQCYDYAFKFLDKNIRLSEINNITLMIKNNINEFKYSNNSTLLYLTKLNKFFKYCIDSNYIEKNPIINLLKPNSDITEKNIITKLDLDKILNYFKNKDYYSYLLFKFLSLTGLRREELYKLYFNYEIAPYIKNTNLKSCIYENYILVDGKRIKVNIPKIREIPIDLIPDLRQTINELKQFNYDKVLIYTSMFLFKHLKICIKKLNLNPNYSLHSFRKYATNYWETELNFSDKLCSILGGHTRYIRNKAYEKTEYNYTEILELYDSSPIHIKSYKAI